jgi:hypothetical protein
MRTRPVLLRITPIAVLAIITVASLAFGGSAEPSGVSSAESATGKDSTGTKPEVVLYYFHGTRRCNTCRTIESYSQEAVEGKFKNALEAGTLSWTVLNTDESENAHFVKDFGLVSSSLVLVEVDGGEVVRHQILQDAWTLVRDKPRFIEYVQGSIGEFLE